MSRGAQGARPRRRPAWAGLLLLLLGAFLAPTPLAGSPTAGLEVRSTTVSAGGRSYPVSLVRVDLSRLRVRVGLAHGQVGRTEDLGALARREGAVAALNGSYFEAYTDRPLKNPNHTLIRDGRLVNKGNVGSLLGFNPQGEGRIDRVPLTIRGALDGNYKHPDNWYAYWVNRLPEGSGTVTLFTRAWGAATGLAEGRHVVVSQGKVVRIAEGSQPIPDNGYVVYLRGRQEEKLVDRFRVGRLCEYRVIREDGRPMGFWAGVSQAIGAGPRLVTDGQVTCDPGAEGFRDPKITVNSAARSVVGLGADGSLLMVTSAGTVREMADLMLALGARQAMCMDGGASSGLWVQGRYLATPGRDISNALLVLERRDDEAGPAPPDGVPAIPASPTSVPAPLPSEAAGLPAPSPQPRVSGPGSAAPSRIAPAPAPGFRRSSPRVHPRPAPARRSNPGRAVGKLLVGLAGVGMIVLLVAAGVGSWRRREEEGLRL